MYLTMSAFTYCKINTNEDQMALKTQYDGNLTEII